MPDMEFERFWTKVDKTPTCWLWTAKLNGTGYGSIGVKGKKYLAHRLSYEIANGPFDKALFVLHRCDVRNCVRPDHLWLGTQSDNMLDCQAKGRNPNGYKWTTADNPNKGIPLPQWQRERVRQAQQRPFTVMGPAGEIITGVNLTHFCRVHGLNQGAMWSVIKGDVASHKGYTQAPQPKIV